MLRDVNVIIRSVMEVYERGQTIAALRRAEIFAPLNEWQGVKPRVLAARIAAHAGAPRLAVKLTLRAWKADKRDAEALAQMRPALLEIHHVIDEQL